MLTSLSAGVRLAFLCSEVSINKKAAGMVASHATFKQPLKKRLFSQKGLLMIEECEINGISIVDFLFDKVFHDQIKAAAW